MAASNIATSSSVKVHPKHPNTCSAWMGLFTGTMGTPPLAMTYWRAICVVVMSVLISRTGLLLYRDDNELYLSCIVRIFRMTRVRTRSHNVSCTECNGWSFSNCAKLNLLFLEEDDDDDDTIPPDGFIAVYTPDDNPPSNGSRINGTIPKSLQTWIIYKYF